MTFITPFWLLLLPIIAGLVAYTLQRWVWLQAILGGIFLLLVAFLVSQIPLEQIVVVAGRDVTFQAHWELLGRDFILHAHDRPAILFTTLAVAFFFLGAPAARVPRHFVSMGFAILALLNAIILVGSFLLAALLFPLLAIAAIFLLVGEEPMAHSGAFRLLLIFTLVVPFLLLANWQLEGLLANPEDLTQADRGRMLLAIALLILAGVIPFHSWIPLLTQQAKPYPVAFVATMLSAGGLLFSLDILHQYPDIANQLIFQWGMRWGGIALCLYAGIFALGQRDVGKLMGLGMVMNGGMMAYALGMGTLDGQKIALMLLAIRTAAGAVWGLGWGRDRAQGRRSVVNMAAATVGIAAMVGFPLTMGFPAFWAAYRVLAGESLWVLVSVLLAGGSVLFSYLVAVGERLPADSSEEDLNQADLWVGWFYAGVGIAVVILFGIFPQWVLPIFARWAELL